jgi:hypothetical protein
MRIGFISDEEDRSPIIGTWSVSQLTSEEPEEASSLGTNAAALAIKAASLVGGDRAEQHGDKAENFEKIAGLWNAYLAIRREPGSPLNAVDIGHMMALLKVARTQTGALNEDDWTDGCGYLACAGEIALKA